MWSTPERLLYASYAAYSQHFVDLRGLPARLGESLWIGSYFGLVAQLPEPPTLLLDIDTEAVREAVQHFPGIPVVQADLCNLPFHQCFDTIIMLGAVSAYLLDDACLARAAHSLCAALRQHPARCLYLDAYHRRYILDSRQFNGSQTLMLRGQRWRREARSVGCPGESLLFDVTLYLQPEDGSQSARHYHFQQRAFDPDEFYAPFKAHGLVCRDVRVDEHSGRFVLVLGA